MAFTPQTLPTVNPTNAGNPTPASSPYIAPTPKAPVTPTTPTPGTLVGYIAPPTLTPAPVVKSPTPSTIPTTVPIVSTTAPWGTNSSGIPYGSQDSNNPNPDTSVYGQNGNPVVSSTTGNSSGTQSTGNADVDALAADQNAEAASQKQLGDTIQGILNGSVPLSASDQAQIQGLENQYSQTIATQGLINANTVGTTSQRGFQTGAAEYDSTFRSNTINSVLSAGATKIATLQTQEASAVAQLTESLQNNDIAGIKDAYVAYTASNTATQDALKTTIADTQQAMKDSSVQSVIASGVTDPADILATLQKQGQDDISLSDINTVISALSPDAANIFKIQQAAAANGAPQSVLASIGSAQNQSYALTAAGVFNTTLIPDLQKLAESNGAPQSVIDSIGQSTDSNSALQVAAGYTQTASGTLGDYLEYQRQTIAVGQTPEDYTTYQNAQNATAANLAMNKAIQTADAEAKYKSQLDAQNGVLTSQDSTEVNAVVSQLNSNKDVQAFMSIAGQLPILQSIPAGTTDPAEQAQLLTSIAHILSPNSSSLRGALNAVPPGTLNSGVYNALNSAAQTVDARGTLSPAAVNQLISIGQDEYNSYLNTYQSIRSAAIAPLASRGIDVDSYVPDYSSVSAPTPTQVVQQQTDDAATAVASFINQSSQNSGIYQQVLQAAPNATPIEIAQTLGIIPNTSGSTQQ